MINFDPFSPKEDHPSPLRGIRVSEEIVVTDELTQALMAGETRIREERARVLAALGDSSCRGCYLFNNQKDPLAWARNGKNISAHSVLTYTDKYVGRLDAAEKGRCGGIIDRTPELLEELGADRSDIPEELLDKIAPIRCGQDEDASQRPLLR